MNDVFWIGVYPGLTPAKLSDVHATMAQWLGVSVPNGSGRPIVEILL